MTGTGMHMSSSVIEEIVKSEQAKAKELADKYSEKIATHGVWHITWALLIHNNNLL